MDARAIAIELLVDNEWEHVGYMVTEVLDSVHHKALNNNKITSIELDWVKFITNWSRSVLWNKDYSAVFVLLQGPFHQLLSNF